VVVTGIVVNRPPLVLLKWRNYFDIFDILPSLQVEHHVYLHLSVTMRISAALLAAPLVAFANPIERRQSGLFGLLGGGKTTQPFKIEDGKPTIKRDGVKTAVLWHGPYKLPGNKEVIFSDTRVIRIAADDFFRQLI
jgi:hypothetical protein